MALHKLNAIELMVVSKSQKKIQPRCEILSSLYGIMEIVAMQYRLFNNSTKSFSHAYVRLLKLVCGCSSCMKK